MSNIVSTNYTSDQIFMEGKQEVPETLSVSVAGTAATITDTTSYSVSDLSTLTDVITILHADRSDLNVGAQTVTFPASTTTALTVAAAYNDQLRGANATVTGGQVVISSDAVGSGVTITHTAGTATDLTFGTPVAGTGNYAGVVVSAGTLLARTTVTSSPYSAGDIVTYNSGNSPTGASTIRGIAGSDYTFTASGSKAINMAIAGKAVQGKITKVGGTPTQAELDALVTNTGITYKAVVDGIDSQV